MSESARVETIFLEIVDFCRKNADSVQADKYRRYFAEGYDPYGIPQDVYDRQKEEWIKKYRDVLSADDVLRLGELLFKSGKYEEGSFAIGIMVAYKDGFTVNTFQGTGRWLESGVCNWAHTDSICTHLLTHFIKNGIVTYEDMSAWRNSPSRWKRRAVPVTMLACLKRDFDTKELLEFIRPMMADKERVVHQGVGWLLREIWKKDPEPVEEFLLEWKDTAPRLIFQYATEKMSKEEKSRFKKAPKASTR